MLDPTNETINMPLSYDGSIDRRNSSLAKTIVDTDVTGSKMIYENSIIK